MFVSSLKPFTWANGHNLTRLPRQWNEVLITNLRYKSSDKLKDNTEATLLLSKQHCSEKPPTWKHESRWLSLAESILGNSGSANITNHPSDVVLLVLQEKISKETLYLQAWKLFSSLLVLLVHSLDQIKISTLRGQGSSVLLNCSHAVLGTCICPSFIYFRKAFGCS